MTLFTVNPRGCGSFTTSTGGTRARSRGCPMRSSSCRGSGRGRGRGRGRAASCGSARPSSCAGACRAPAPGPTWTSTTTRRCVRAAPCRGWRGSVAGGVVFLQTGTLTSYSVINVLSIYCHRTCMDIYFGHSRTSSRGGALGVSIYRHVPRLPHKRRDQVHEEHHHVTNEGNIQINDRE